MKQVMEHIWKFQEFCNSMTRLETDSYEYAYLKAIVLFSPGECLLSLTKLIIDIPAFISQIERTRCVFYLLSDHPGVDSSGQIEKFQEKALMELQDYVQKTYPDDTYRYIQ